MKRNFEIEPVLLTEKAGRDGRGRFKPGHSGNPDGRPPKAETWLEIFDDELSKLIDFKDEKQTSRISKKRAIARRLILKALSGELPAIREILEKTTIVIDADEKVDLTAWAVALEKHYEAENDR